jgi:hypothetical protein
MSRHSSQAISVLLKRLGMIVLVGTLSLSSSPSWAIPQLQLYFDPATNPGAAYDPVDQGWGTVASPMTLTAFMQGLDTSHTFRVFISLPDRPIGSDPNGLISLTITEPTAEGFLGTPGPWVFGNPGLPPHGIFDTWYTYFDFNFLDPDNNFSVFNVEPSSGGSVSGTVGGFRDDFRIGASGPGSNAFYHFDLVDVNSFNANQGRFSDSAPPSHDAQGNLQGGPPQGNPTATPEPSTMVLIFVGMVAYLLVGTRRRKLAAVKNSRS